MPSSPLFTLQSNYEHLSSNIYYMSRVEQFLGQFDLFAAPPTLRSRGNPETTNICGSILSIVFLIAFTILFFINSVNILQYNSIEVSERQQKQTSEAPINDILFAVGLRYAFYDEFKNYFSFRAYIQTKQTIDSEFYFDYEEIELELCRLEDWAALGSEYQTIFYQYYIDQSLCPVKGQDVFVQNGFLSRENAIILIEVMECFMDSWCVNFNNTFYSGFMEMNYLEGVLMILDTGLNPTKFDPVFYDLKNIRGPFSMHTATEIIVQLSKFEVETDESWLPWTSITKTEGYFVGDTSDATYPAFSLNPLLTFMITFSQEKRILERNIGKVDDMLSYLGGLFAIIIAFLGFFMMSFNQYRYQIMVAEGAFNYNDEGDKLKAENFHFFKYVKYVCYDWIKTLTCCQPPWHDCRQIDETREEANSQLDVSLLFKRIQHLERAIEYLLNEREEICLYLTEPPSLDEVKRKRKLTEYYDKIIKGEAALTVQDIKTHVKQNVENIFKLGLSKHRMYEDSLTFSRNSRIRQDIDASRENILDYALEKHEQRQEQFDLDEEDEVLEKQFAEAFFHMQENNRRRIQQKVPIKIIKRLQKKLQKMNTMNQLEIKIDI